MRLLAIASILLSYLSSPILKAQNINFSGSISTNTVWDKASIDTVKVTGDIIIETGNVLTIEPGIVVDFTGHYQIDVDGTITANGTETDSIRFTTSDTTGFHLGTHTGWGGIRFVNLNYTDSTTTFQYCVFEYGKALGSGVPEASGGAIYASQTFNIELTNSKFQYNYADENGGALYAFYTFFERTISDCEFTNNVAGAIGGAIYLDRAVPTTLSNNVITNNLANVGGGMYLGNTNNNPVVINNRIGHNVSLTAGGGINSGATYATISHNFIYNNDAQNSGGGLWQTYCSGCRISNNVIVNNSAGQYGGGVGVFNVYSNTDNDNFINNTIAHNEADRGGGLYVFDQQNTNDLFVTKTIFRANISTQGGGVNNDLYLVNQVSSSYAATRFYSCIFGGDLTNTLGSPQNYSSLLNTDPEFISSSGGPGAAFEGYEGRDWSVNFCNPSPAIDGGEDLIGLELDSIDISGKLRWTGSTVDIGAYESYGFYVTPQPMATCENGGDAYFTSKHNGSPNSTQWQYHDGGSWNDLANSGTYDGVNDDSLSITSVDISFDGYLYRNAADYGCRTVFSSEPELTVNPTFETIVDVAICSNDSIMLQGNYRDTAGTFYDTLLSINGCDSVVQTNLTIDSSYLFVDSLDICNGDSIMIYGNYEKTANTYEDEYQTIDACDSIYQTVLTINPIYYENTFSTICDNDSVYLEGAWQNMTGTYFDTLSTAMYGCDSVIETSLTVNSAHIVQVNDTICSGDSIQIGNVWRSTSGQYSDSLSTPFSCDSIRVIDLFVKPSPIVNIGPDTLLVCDQQVLDFNVDDTNGDIASYIISNFFTNVNDEALSFTFNSFTPASSVIAEATGTNGCVTTDRVVLKANDIINVAFIPTDINDPHVTVEAVAIPDNLDNWYWSFGDGDTAAATTIASHSYNQMGNFDVCLIAQNSCGIDSICSLNLDIFNPVTHIEEGKEAITGINIYPSPTKGVFNVQLQEVTQNTKLLIVSTNGEVVYHHTLETLNTRVAIDIPNGMYYAVIKNQKDSHVIPLVISR